VTCEWQQSQCAIMYDTGKEGPMSVLVGAGIQFNKVIKRFPSFHVRWEYSRGPQFISISATKQSEICLNSKTNTISFLHRSFHFEY